MTLRTTTPFKGVPAIPSMKIRFKDEIFDVSAIIFAAYSRRFVAELRTIDSNEFIIRGDVTVETVREFIRACQSNGSTLLTAADTTRPNQTEFANQLVESNCLIATANLLTFHGPDEN